LPGGRFCGTRGGGEARAGDAGDDDYYPDLIEVDK
jgi:hypothetical protein